jgi:3-phenylpropionate/trans-cinnamate dioxygenase ferredoxin reductase subunit
LTDPVVVVGGGQAAVQLCLALRKEKYSGDIAVLSDDESLPYHRPPLSKAFVTGETDEEKLVMRPASFYETREIDLVLGATATGIDLANRRVVTGNTGYQYRHLVLANGAVSRKLSVEGSDASGVFELRNLDDAKAIKRQLESTSSVAVIGAGFIGLEVAAALNRGQCKVTVFDTADRVMGRAVSVEVSDWFAEMHRAAGIDILLNEGVARICVDANGRTVGVERTNGDVIDADMVLVGIGVLPDTGLAEAAGLACDNGVLVDEFCRTADPAVFAAGDCANHPNRYAGGRRVRLESIQNATDQARVVASVIASSGAGKAPSPYNSVPWFWSDQAQHSLQMAGLAFDVDNRVVRGSPADGSFSVFQYSADKLVAVDSVNAARDHMLARKLLAADVSPTASSAADDSFDLKSLLG